MIALRLPARIGLTLAVNLLLLGGLFGALLVQQNRKGLESFLMAPSLERIRAMAGEVAEREPHVPVTDLLTRFEEQYGVRVVLYEGNGRLVAGADLNPPEEVRLEIRRQPRRAEDVRERAARGTAHPVFLVRDTAASRYWVGVHFPLWREEAQRQSRHALLIVTTSLLGNSLFFDWQPWAAGILGALLVSALCWLPAVHYILASIRTMRQAAGQIAEGRFEVQIPSKGRDEFGELAGSLEKMAEKIARLVHGQRRFLADVAHELCAPLSRVQLSAGILEDRAQPGDLEYVKGLERDVRHMSNLVSDLLSFSKGTTRRLEPKPLAMATLLEEVCLSEQTQGSKVDVQVNAGLVVLADEETVRRAVGNVIRNAVAYAGEAGPIAVRAQRTSKGVRISVEDEGPGLPEKELDAVFEPFYRPDLSRDRATGGTGLGLAIVKSCMDAIGGTVHCQNREPRGLRVVLEIPGAPPAG